MQDPPDVHGGADSSAKTELSDLQKRINDLIKPKGHPIAFKMFHDETDLDERMISHLVRTPLALCQVMKLVNIYGIPKLMVKENRQGCSMGEHSLGFSRIPNELCAAWRLIFGMEPQDFEKIAKDILSVPLGEYAAVFFAPLRSFDEFSAKPDGVIFNVNGTQALLLLWATYIGTMEKPVWSYNGNASCEIVAALKLGKSPWFVMPCLGARSLASTQDDELWFGLSLKHLKLAERSLARFSMSYPPAVEQALFVPPLSEHMITKLISKTE